MDRDNRWDRTAKAYNAIALGNGLRADSAEEALEQAYRHGETDEFVLPSVIGGDGAAYSGLAERDCIIFFNFRSDRPRQLTESLFQKQFTSFERKQFFGIQLICMTQYNAEFNLPTLFPPLSLEKGLGEVLSDLGFTQLRIAETEKYAHVTFFFNGGREKPYPSEQRILVKSLKVATYDLKPEMSAFEVTAKLIASIKSNAYDFVLVNYANPDLIAHTGNLSATVQALELVDKCLLEVIEAVESVGGLCVVTSDHGHAEQLIDYETGGPWTAHTTNSVPFVIVTEKKLRLHAGRLADVAPTILQLMQVKKPLEMSGRSLVSS
jgi:2,3-bisphosphoglycerate-independent phosphoglycerate mutase